MTDKMKMILWIAGVIIFLNTSLLIMPNIESASSVSLSIGEVTDSSVQLYWSKSQDYSFEKYVVGYDYGSDWTEVITKTGIYQTSHKVTGLSPSTTYRFRIRDYDSFGYADSNIVTVTTKSSTILGLEPMHLCLTAITLIVTIIILIVYFAIRSSSKKKTHLKESISERQAEPRAEVISLGSVALKGF